MKSLHAEDLPTRALPILLFVLALPLSVAAETELAVPTPQACTRLASAQDVLDCAIQRHPDAQRARLAELRADKLEAQASLLPNPELGGKSVFGSSLGDSIANHEVNLTQPIELGGKRRARIEKALADKDAVLAGSQRQREEVLLSTLHTLYRIRQVQSELHILDEALETFRRIQRQFRSRPRRTPEQEVSLGVFDLAEGDYQLRKASLESELNSSIQTISLAIGAEFKPSAALLPPQRKAWPKLADGQTTTAPKGSALRVAKAELRQAEAELAEARAFSWPDLRIGPSFESQTSGPTTFQTYGINLSIELPVFQANGAGRATALAGVDLAERSLSLREREVASRRSILVGKYQSAVKSIEASLSHSELERKHKNTDALFTRGVIPSSLVIEAHRQLIDFTRNQNEQELSALESLWEIYALEGRALEEKL